jgi:hypothetical protein
MNGNVAALAGFVLGKQEAQQKHHRGSRSEQPVVDAYGRTWSKSMRTGTLCTSERCEVHLLDVLRSACAYLREQIAKR